MVLRVTTVREAIRALSEENPGRFSAELGMDFSEGRSREVFRWLLSFVLFGATISETIARNIFRREMRGFWNKAEPLPPTALNGY